MTNYMQPAVRLTNFDAGQALSVSQNVFEESRTTIRTEAAHFGLQALDNASSDVANSDATFLELIRYRESKLLLYY